MAMRRRMKSASRRTRRPTSRNSRSARRGKGMRATRTHYQGGFRA